MTDRDLIATWIDQPNLIKEEPLERINHLILKYPLFAPLRLIKQMNQFVYKEAPFNSLLELFPFNRVKTSFFFQYDAPFSSILTQIKDKEDKKTLKSDSGNTQPAPEKVATPTFEMPNQSAMDYFKGQGVEVETDLPEKEEVPSIETKEQVATDEGKTPKDLMVVMSFSEWLTYLQKQSEKDEAERESQSALKAMWQREKLKSAMEEEEEEIPENVFKMAVDSITPNEGLLSESLAQVYALQGKKDKALEIYQKLSLQNPQKRTYFAKKIEELQKDLDL